ncbi:iron-containing alcohol dehydrogenase family protein [Chondromyces crocatus]|uniref:Uncharacterized protein n=1 Tax=Chondromyces crocatus TaxID=52 RepID=A0A0K1ESY6_CHOCO|nr:iron-containing alcohol dehydrogenase [Chondromyces crocatus]AKT43976.1 uncharacterized protein CMC5_082140 [Chondromyces crocatus]
MAADLPLKPFGYTAPQIHFGAGALSRLGSALRGLGASRALLVCDAHLTQADLATLVAEASQGRVAGVWSRVETDAPRASVEAAADEARRLDVDAVVALGSGSALHTGKAAALLARRGDTLGRTSGTVHVEERGLPVIAIPTTAGNGSEVSGVAVVKHADLRRKQILVGRALQPEVVLLDPTLLTTVASDLTAATGVDALTHAFEGLTSTDRHPISTALGLESVHLLRSWLPRAVAAPLDLDARGHTLLASAMAGQLATTAYGGVARAVIHALSLGWDTRQGLASAAVLPWSIRFNASDATAAAIYARTAPTFGVAAASDDREAARALADKLERFAADLGLPTRLGALGLGASDLERLSELAFADASHATNPVRLESARGLADALKTLV